MVSELSASAVLLVAMVAGSCCCSCCCCCLLQEVVVGSCCCLQGAVGSCCCCSCLHETVGGCCCWWCLQEGREACVLASMDAGVGAPASAPVAMFTPAGPEAQRVHVHVNLRCSSCILQEKGPLLRQVVHTITVHTAGSCYQLPVCSTFSLLDVPGSAKASGTQRASLRAASNSSLPRTVCNFLSAG
jgi:hypothetical protein